MKNILLSVCLVIFLPGCAFLGDAVRTIPDIARTLCMLAAAERSEAEKAAQSDEHWCVMHAAEYLEAVGKAKRAASKKAGLRR